MTRHPIKLGPDVAHCPSTRTVACSLADQCARALVNWTNRPVQDYSIETRGPGGQCRYYLSAATYRIAPPSPGPTVHEAL